MSHSIPHRSIYTLVLIGALVACSAPAQQAEPTASSDVPTADGTTVAASGDATALVTPPGSSEAAGASGAAGSATSSPASTPAEAAARERVQAARQEANQAQTQSVQQAAQQCRDLASQIRAELATERAAPSTSIDEDIVAATLAKADQRIDRLQQQYDSLNCPDSERPATHERVPQLPPAPGALPP
jgi:hypothetical protein